MQTKILFVMIAAVTAVPAWAHEGLRDHGWMHEALHKIGATDWSMTTVLGAFLGVTAVAVAAGYRNMRHAPKAELAKRLAVPLSRAQ